MADTSTPNAAERIAAHPVTERFVAEVSGVDLSRPLSDDAFARVLEHFHRYRIVFFRNQQITPEQLAEFGARFGELEAFATQPPFVYSHPWQKGDLVVWDNRVTLHCATSCQPPYRRTMQRVQAIGEVPIAA